MSLLEGDNSVVAVGAMKSALLILGLFGLAMGLLWVGQGMGLVHWPASSFMIDQRPWVARGALLAFAGRRIAVTIDCAEISLSYSRMDAIGGLLPREREQMTSPTTKAAAATLVRLRV